MKGMLLRFITALLTFGVGCLFAVSGTVYNKSIRATQEDKRKQAENVVSVSLRESQPLYTIPESLAVELKRVDKIYKKRCGEPNEYYDGWPGIKSLDKLRVCYDEWARARLKAIDAERSQHLVMN
jgi:hypothetical protein